MMLNTIKLEAAQMNFFNIFNKLGDFRKFNEFFLKILFLFILGIIIKFQK